MNKARANQSFFEINLSAHFVNRSVLFESEFGIMFTAVGELYNKYPARSFPRLFCLPDVAVLIGRRVVAQTAAARIDRWFNRAARFTGVARDGSRNRIARRDDVQALIAAQRELYRNSLTCIDDVDRRQIFHRREESDKVINDLIIGVSVGGVACQIRRSASDGFEADACCINRPAPFVCD